MRRHHQLQLTLRWVPGHEGVAGNERADREAKRAARALSSPEDDLPACLRDPLPISVSKVRQTFTSHFRSNLRTLSCPSPRPHASLLIQLRSGHAPLQQYLHRIRRTPSSICPSCHAAKETVRHFLLDCPTYRRQREALTRSLGRSARSIKHLSKGGVLKHLFRYIHATGRFAASLGNLEIHDGVDSP